MPRSSNTRGKKEQGGKGKKEAEPKAGEDGGTEAPGGESIPVTNGVRAQQKPYREYIVALEQALEDKVITVDEMRVLEYLREEYGISRDEHDILMAVMLKRFGGRMEEWLPGDEFFSDLFSGRKYIKPKPYEFCRQRD